MNVVIVMPLAEASGGSERALLRLLAAPAPAGVRWHVVFLESGPMVADVAALGLPVEVLEAGRLRDVGRFVATVRRLARQVQAWTADVVLAWMTKGHLYAGLAALLAGVPAAWFQHGRPSAKSLIDRLATALPARVVLTCSAAVAHEQGALWPRRLTAVAYPPIDLVRFDAHRLPSPEDARRRLGLDPSRPLIGMVGRLQRWKGVHVFVDAVARLREQHDVQGVIVGGVHELEAAYAAQVQQQVEARGLTEHLVLAGVQEDVPLWMQAMDVIVHASDWEPFGMVIAEAMALGKPVVVGARGGPAEIVMPEVDALVAPFGDAAVLARQVERLLTQHSLAERLGRAARARAAAFTPDAFARAVAEPLADIHAEGI